MKKNMIFTILSIVCLTAKADDAKWWNQPTVCKYNPKKCYTVMGAGFEPEMWDTSANCRGMKYICPNALKTPSQKPELVGIKNIENMINPDFAPDLLGESGDCFGKRHSKITKENVFVMVNGDYVNLYCHGILNKPDETLADGEIIYNHDEQPTCESLKTDGYIAVKNGKCVGKSIDDSKYYIDCDKKNLLPKRLVLLNGAEITTTNTAAITTQKDADNVFNTMYSASKKQKTQYFKK